MRRVKTVSFSISEESAKYITDMSKAENVSRSAFLDDVIRRQYAMQKLNELAEIGRRQAKKLGIRSEDDVDRIIHEYRAEIRKEAAQALNRKSSTMARR